MRSYTSDAKAVLAANVVSTLAGLGVQACLAWLLLPEGRGEYATCILFATMLILTCTLGQEMANVYYVGSKQLTATEALSQSLAMGVVTSGVACTIGYLLTLTALPFLDKAPVALFRLSLFCVPATIFHMYITRIFLGMASIPTFTILTAAPRILALLALVIGAVTHLDVRLALLIHAGSEGIIALVGGVRLATHHGARLIMPQTRTLLRSLGYGARFYFGKLASMANVQMGTLILSLSRVSVADIGLFAAASVLASRVWIMADALQTAMLPRAAADPTGKRDAIAQCVRLCLICTVVVSAALCLLAAPIIALVLSPRFLPVVTAFRILLPGVCVRVIPKILSAYFNGIGRPGITSTAIAVAVALNIALMYILLPLWGLVGVAIAMVVAYCTEAVILTLAFRRLSGTSIRDLCQPTRGDVSTLIRVGRRLLAGERHAPSAVVEPEEAHAGE